MRKLHIVNFAKEPVGTIIWNDSGDLAIEDARPNYEASLESLVKDLEHKEFPLRSGHEREVNGQKVFVENRIMVKRTDEQFLDAVSGFLTRIRLAGDRVFGIVAHDSDSE